MIDQAASPLDIHAADRQHAEATLRRDLARGDAAAASALPVLRHLIAADENALLSEEVMTRVRAMLADIAAQLLDGLIGDADRRSHAPEEIAVLTGAFLHDADLLGHVHTLALEWHLTGRLQVRFALDPVVSPLVRKSLLTDDAAARAFVSAQARWTQAQQGMSLPLSELPELVLDAVLGILRRLVGAEPSLAERARQVEADVRECHAAGSSRLDAAARFAARLQDEALLHVEEAGAALFLTALAQRSGIAREAALLATQPGQQARLTLALAAAGASTATVKRQLVVFHGAGDPVERIVPDRALAAAILSGGAA